MIGLGSDKVTWNRRMHAETWNWPLAEQRWSVLYLSHSVIKVNVINDDVNDENVWTGMWFFAFKIFHYLSRPVPVAELFSKYPTCPVPKSKTPTRRTLVKRVEVEGEAEVMELLENSNKISWVKDLLRISVWKPRWAQRRQESCWSPPQVEEVSVNHSISSWQAEKQNNISEKT